MKKKDLKGGLANLLSGIDQSVTQPKAEAQQQAAAPALEQEPTTQQDEIDLINSIEDEQLRAALRAKRMEGRGRPRKNTDKNGKRTDGYGRTSLILNLDKVAKIKEIAFRETLTMKEIFEAALDDIIEKYEAKHGEVIPQPEKYKGDINKVFG